MTTQFQCYCKFHHPNCHGGKRIEWLHCWYHLIIQQDKDTNVFFHVMPTACNSSMQKSNLPLFNLCVHMSSNACICLIGAYKTVTNWLLVTDNKVAIYAYPVMILGICMIHFLSYMLSNFLLFAALIISGNKYCYTRFSLSITDGLYDLQMRYQVEIHSCYQD